MNELISRWVARLALLAIAAAGAFGLWSIKVERQHIWPFGVVSRALPGVLIVFGYLFLGIAAIVALLFLVAWLLDKAI